jgi:transglutaminase superfamily protein
MSERPIVVGSPYHELVTPIHWTRKVALAVEIAAVYAHVRWLLWRRDLPRVVAELRGSEPLATDLRRQAIGARLGQAIERTVSLVPFDSRCLVRSLVLVRLLGRRGIASTLVIGVGVEPEFTAHAWVESGGRALLPPLDDTSRLVEL